MTESLIVNIYEADLSVLNAKELKLHSLVQYQKQTMQK